MVRQIADLHFQITRAKDGVELNSHAKNASPRFGAKIFLVSCHRLEQDDFVGNRLCFAFDLGPGHHRIVLWFKRFARLL